MTTKPLVMTWEELLATVPLEEQEIREQIADGRFPKPRQLTRTKVGWLVAEIERWLAELPLRQSQPAETTTELYRHFDAAGRLLYVGVSLSTTVRLMAHMARAAWADQIAIITIQRFYTREAALQAERAAIKAEKPVHNIVHASRE